VITKGQAVLFDRLMRDGATVIEATGVVKLATELAAWEHELRGAHGKWASGGLGAGESVKVVPRSVPVTPSKSAKAAAAAAAKPKLPFRTSTVPLRPGRPTPQTPDAITAQVTELIDARVAKAVVDRTAETTRRLHGQAMSSMRLEDLKRRAEEQARLHHKTKHKAAVEIGITVGALVLAIVEGIIGLPGLTQVISAMAPPVAQAVVEWRKRL
jgi:hypothetical protein